MPYSDQIISHIEEETKQNVLKDRIAVSVSSPDFGHKDDLLLGVVPSTSGKAMDQALIIQNLVEYFEIPDNVMAICTDTTATNTGRKEGAIVILTKSFGKPLLWLMCRHHIYERHITHAYKVLSGEETKAPRKALYINFQKRWEEFYPIIAKGSEKFKKFDEKLLLPGSSLHTMYLEAKNFIAYALEQEVFPEMITSI